MRDSLDVHGQMTARTRKTKKSTFTLKFFSALPITGITAVDVQQKPT